MKKLIKLASVTIITVGMFVAQSSSAQDVIFSTDFKPNPESDQPVSTIDWAGYQGADAASVWATGSKPAAGAWHSSSGVGLLFATGNPGPLLLYTELSPFGAASTEYTFDQVGSVTLGLQNSTTTEDVKVAIRVGTSWYASDENLNNAVANVITTGIVLDLPTANWRALTVAPGGELSIAGTVSAITGTDYITAVGIFTSDVERVRLTSYEVATIPEPSSVALFFGAFVGVGVVLRRRL
ncbi:PEP-CTERM sorting domain-containing protein [Coraliomargarita sp. W4R53]